ncbi:hypothetical protein THRCLA_05104 [Thraustotheca clavata]|uniref:Glutamine amidotransferase type-2 domain-containing protein n=1 Tax=Thraustotheca clavata TaxID=74557 RepID=A0A1V9ZWY7_9STRA|nr:hypothetical protein THRCLA_05104 [Thraustotheca clavata]
MATQHDNQIEEIDGKASERLKMVHSSPELDIEEQVNDESDEEINEEASIDGKDFAMFKVLVVGMAKSGKTSLIRRFVHGTFADIYKTTVGADYSDKTLAIDDTLDVCLQIWDIAGQDRFAHLTRRYFTNADAAVIVCDITSQPTIAAVVDWKRELDACCEALFPVLLVANKCDLLHDVPQALEYGASIQKMVMETGIEDWFRVSAKSGEKVDEAMDLLVKRMTMCRMTIYKGLGLDQSILLADLIVKPKHSIIHQSYNCTERFHNTGLPSQLNADGFGIGWYAEKLYSNKQREYDEVMPSPKKQCRHSDSVDGVVVPRNREYETPCVFTSISPAWNNRNLVQLADKVSSPLFFAHVRAASIGSLTSETNCHPFTFDKYLFMHNGGVSDFSKIKRRLIDRLSEVAYDMIRGSTDSEHCFALYLTELEKIGPLEGEFTGKEMRSAMFNTIRIINALCRETGITEPSLLNFAVTDGDTLIATRYVNVDSSAAASLYFTSGSRWIRSVERPKEYIMQRHNKEEKVFVMASERLSNELGDWLEVPKNAIVTVSAEMNIQICPIKNLLDDEVEPDLLKNKSTAL